MSSHPGATLPVRQSVVSVPAAPQQDAEAARRHFPLVAAAALLLVIGARVCYVFTHRVNGDEPQHLHVVWAWTQGLLP
jgi:prolipoprotein diacylglyceryltransferase